MRRSGTWLFGCAAVLLGSSVAWGATITVNTTTMWTIEDDHCSFLEAMENANDGAVHVDCVAGDPGLDIIELGEGETYNFTHGYMDEGTMFRVREALSIVGNGSTVQRHILSGPLKEFIRANQGIHLALYDIAFRQWEWAVSGAGPLMLTDCSFHDNDTGVSAFGMALLTNCIFSANSTAVSVFLSGASVTLMDCTLVQNDIAVDVLTDIILRDNMVRMVRCDLSENNVGLNAGPYVDFALGEALIIVDDCALSGNGWGVAISPAAWDADSSVLRVLLRQTTIDGGEIGVRIGGPVETRISNCTISGNMDPGSIAGAGIALVNVPGSEHGTVTVANSTIWHNDYALYLSYYGGWPGRLTLRDSVLAGSRTNCDAEYPDELHLESQGSNITDDNSCNLDHPNDLVVDDVMLSELGDYGGPTPVHMPLEGSPIIDMGGYQCSRFDQRGFGRPADGDGDGVAYCDCGAVEAGAVPYEPPGVPGFPDMPPDTQ